MSKRLNKFFSFSVAALASVVALAFVAPGCGSEPADDSCYDYAAFNGTAKTVSFKTDVLPIFRQSCGLSAACHGSPTGPAGQPYLGPGTNDPDPVQADIDKIFAQNVGATSTKAATMKIVEAGSPQKSFLMHKMDNTLKCSDVVCEANCGASMPLANPVLDETKLDIVRSWIAQGAKND